MGGWKDQKYWFAKECSVEPYLHRKPRTVYGLVANGREYGRIPRLLLLLLSMLTRQSACIPLGLVLILVPLHHVVDSGRIRATTNAVQRAIGQYGLARLNSDPRPQSRRSSASSRPHRGVGIMNRAKISPTSNNGSDASTRSGGQGPHVGREGGDRGRGCGLFATLFRPENVKM